MRNYLILVVLISCSHKPREDSSTLNPWIGRPIGQLESHPYFSKLTTKTEDRGKVKVKVFRERSPTHSQARCAVVGCQYENDIDCHNIFQIKSEIIIGARREGTCRPHDELLPVMPTP